MTSREFYLQRAQAEFPVVLNVLRAIPKDQLSYKPDERSPSAEQLAWMLAGGTKACLQAATENKAEWSSDPAPPLNDMVKNFERWSSQLTERVSKMDEQSWERKAQFYSGGKLVTEEPVGRFLWLILFDGIHHRGQLAAYLRPMGGKVPAIYGPSADDNGMGAWQ